MTIDQKITASAMALIVLAMIIRSVIRLNTKEDYGRADEDDDEYLNE